MSPTVWWLLKCATIRVPSANLNWMVVVGLERSTARGMVGEGLLLDVGVALATSLRELLDDPVPSVLPAPWNGLRGLAGSCQGQMVRKPGFKEKVGQSQNFMSTYRIIFRPPDEIDIYHRPPVCWGEFHGAFRLHNTLARERQEKTRNIIRLI